MILIAFIILIISIAACIYIITDKILGNNDYITNSKLEEKRKKIKKF